MGKLVGPNTVEMLGSANVSRVIDHHEASIDGLIQLVRRDDLEVWTVFDHHRRPVSSRHEDVAVGRDWRSINLLQAGHALSRVVSLSGLGVHT